MVNPEHNPGCKVVLVSTCIFLQTDNFHALLSQMRAVCRNWGKEFAGALLRPHAEITRLADFPDDITDAAKKAGLQLAQEGKMDNGTLGALSKELISQEQYVQLANHYIREQMEK